jgi:hypothetical protein
MLDVPSMLGSHSFRESPFGLPDGVVLLVVSTTLMALGAAWVRHILGMDEVLRGGRWRYRDRGRMERLKRTIGSLVEVPFTRTPGWWATRIEFAVAGGALVVATIAITGLPDVVGYRSTGWPVVALTLLGYAGIVFGIRWMRRIYLSPLEVDPEVGFRYRG